MLQVCKKIMCKMSSANYVIHRKTDGQRTPRDEKRRATHNEVERRRRDKINNWIDKLAKMLPESEQDHTKQGQVQYN